MALHEIRSMSPERRALIGQIIRYLIAGGIATAGQAATYWVLAEPMGVHPQVANLAGYVVALCIGFVLHGKVTFRGHSAAGSAAARLARFVTVSLVSLGMNATWVWICTGWMGWPAWSPIPLMVFVTPAVVFSLNRQWVFR